VGYITLGENESIERALKRFKKSCQNSGILAELKRREYYEKPSVKRKKKIEASKRKIRRKNFKVNDKIDKVESL